MRKNVTMLFVCLLFLAFCGANQAKAQNSNLPEAVIKKFYLWYIEAIERESKATQSERVSQKIKDPFDQPLKLKQYITVRLYNELKRLRDKGEYDADYFIDAQDFDKGWGRNVDVSNIAVSKNKASAKVLLKGEEQKGFDQKLKIFLIQERGKWKIDKIIGQN